MTFGQSPQAALDQIVRQTWYLLISFDGPVRSTSPGNPPAPNIHDVLRACRESGRSAAIVGETSRAEVQAYLDLHDLSDQAAIVATSLAEAIDAIKAAPTVCAVVASSPSNIEAAKASGLATIAYSKTPDDADHLAQAGADAFVYSMMDLALKLRSLRQEL
jgi:beta-phosphoglucomutase-like phosphatase (HAD superfamily)